MAQPVETHESCCRIPTTLCPCPVCGDKGRKVGRITLDKHVPSPLREEIGEDVSFCLNPGCEVVYCNANGRVVRKGQTRLPVTIKDPGDEVFVCYCFEHRRADLRRDLAEKGATDIPDRIRKEVQAGRCDCESKNPQGACCLGNVADAIKSIKAEMKSR